jgi:serine/threonine protein phosphatase PrpC
LNILPGVHLFGVFDGHGGPEIALYVADHLPIKLKESKEFLNGNYQDAFV